MRNIAIIPVKENSARLPEKNLRDFFGKPLFMHTVEHARQSKLFDEIHISTSSPRVAEIAKEYALDVHFLRPEELSEPHVGLDPVCEHVIAEFEKRGKDFDNFCMLWATSPMRLVSDITESYATLTERDADAVVGVTEFSLPVQCAQILKDDNSMEMVFNKEKFWGPVTDKFVCDNGSFCWVKVAAFRKHKSWMPPKTYGHHMPMTRAIDVDTQADWEMLEYFYQKHHAK